jgi:hypothetical protein
VIAKLGKEDPTVMSSHVVSSVMLVICFAIMHAAMQVYCFIHVLFLGLE